MSTLSKPGSASTITASLLMVIGLGLSVFALLADWLGIGGGAGFGYQQMIVLIIGLVVMLAGLRMMVGPWLNRAGAGAGRHLSESDR